MGLYVSTTGTSVDIPELGISITHPTTDRELSAQFDPEDIRDANTLTSLIRAGTLVWRKTAGGAMQTPTDYDGDFVDIESENTGLGALYDRTVTFKNVKDGSLDADINSIWVRALTKLTTVCETLVSTATTLDGTLALSSVSNKVQILTGSATGYSIVLPDATTLQPGWYFEIDNRSSQHITVKTYDGVTLFVLSQTSIGYVRLITNSSSAGVWSYWQVFTSSVASGILNYTLTSSTPFATSSLTDVPITGFSLTPQAGTYAIWYSADIVLSANNSIAQSSIYKAGIIVSDSTRKNQGSSSNFVTQVQTTSVIAFNGTETIDVRIRITSGTFTVNARTLVLIRLG